MKNLLKNNLGSIAVEASIVFMVLMIMVTVILNTAVNFSKQDKIQKLSYTIASLAREDQLYDPEFNDDNAQNLFLIAQNLSKHYIKNPDDLGIKIGFYTYNAQKDKTFAKGECDVKREISPNELMLSKKNSLVIVTICLKKTSVVGDISDLFGDSYMYAQSAVIRR